MDKASIAHVLREMGQLLRAKGESVYKSRAYERAATALLELRTPLEELVAQHRLTDIPGVGRSLAHAIEELVLTGTLTSHQKLREEHSPFVATLAELPGVGNKKALALWRALKVESLEALEDAVKRGALQGVKGFGPGLQAQLLAGIQEVRQAPPPRHLLRDAGEVAEQVLRELRSLPGVHRAEQAGEVRRRCETVERLDFVASGPSKEALREAFLNSSHVFETLAQDESSVTVKLYAGGLRARLVTCAPEDFVANWVEATGSAGHVAALRERARKVEPVGQPPGDETQFYRALGLDWVPPELREASGEVEAAAVGKLPALLRAEEVAGLVHSHSTWSDGNASLEQMAVAAREAGYRYLTVTDHSPTASYAGGVTVEALRRQWDEIDALNEQLDGITLLKGTESDIVPAGALDYPDTVLERMDVVVGSVHARHKMDEGQMTRRILDAMDNPHLHILGHLTGRLLLSRPPYAIRLEEILDKAAEKGIAVEVNGSPHRLDIKAEYVRMALERGVKLVVSADAHSVREIANVRTGVEVARKGWATRADVLNTLPMRAFLSRLHRRAE